MLIFEEGKPASVRPPSLESDMFQHRPNGIANGKQPSQGGNIPPRMFRRQMHHQCQNGWQPAGSLQVQKRAWEKHIAACARPLNRGF